MKINLAHSSENIKYKTPWIYFGNSYLKMKNWESRSSGKKINIQDKIHLYARSEKAPFLKWIESQRIFNNDSIYWWMTQIAGRNNSYSNFYLNICQFFAIKDYLKNNSKETILIVCEDIFLLKLIYQNFSSEFKVKIPFLSKFYLSKDIFNLFLKGLLSQFKTIIFLVLNYFCARASRPKKIIKPRGNITLFHHCLDDLNVFKDNNMTCKYFTILPDWLKKKGLIVYSLPWLFKNRTSIKFYKNLRKTNYLIPEDWLSLTDYFLAFKNAIKSLKTLSYNIPYPGIRLDQLVFREKLHQFGEQSAIFWRYIPAIKKWGSEIDSITLYDRYENMMSEHPIRYILKKMPVKSTLIGFYHSLISREYMAYHYLKSEWDSQVKPDYVACLGSFSQNILLEQGVPKERILTAASLRQPFDQKKTIVKKSPKNILILLSLFTEPNLENLTKIYLNNSLIINELNLKVRVKAHPMMNKKSILKKIKWNSLPTGWEWSKKSLYEELSESYCTISMSTASIFDAIIMGNVVISVMSELNIMDNYLDVFSDKHELVNAVPEAQLASKLKDIFILKKKEYEDEFLKIRNKLIAGTNLMEKENLEAFMIK